MNKENSSCNTFEMEVSLRNINEHHDNSAFWGADDGEK